MSMYTRIWVTSKSDVIDYVASRLDNRCKNLTRTNLKDGKYVELFFEVRGIDEIELKDKFESVCAEFSGEKISFVSEVEMSFETYKYLNLNGELKLISFVDSYPYYEDDEKSDL